MTRGIRKQVIPGFGLSMGVTITLLSLIVLIPMASLIINASNMGFTKFIETVTDKRIVSGYMVSFSCALIAAVINAVFGVIIAWVLVRYEFPFKRIVDGLIELPFALPTAVAGIALTSLYSDKGMIGKLFAGWGIKISYTRIGIIIAMIFIGIPFIVRTIQPVLEDLDVQYENAASMLGASRVKILNKETIILVSHFKVVMRKTLLCRQRLHRYKVRRHISDFFLCESCSL